MITDDLRYELNAPEYGSHGAQDISSEGDGILGCHSLLSGLGPEKMVFFYQIENYGDAARCLDTVPGICCAQSMLLNICTERTANFSATDARTKTVGRVT